MKQRQFSGEIRKPEIHERDITHKSRYLLFKCRCILTQI